MFNREQHRSLYIPQYLISGIMFVLIAEVPDAPKQPTVKEVYHDSALISWEPPADGGKQITGYIVERKETKANRYTNTSGSSVVLRVKIFYSSTVISKNLGY